MKYNQIIQNPMTISVVIPAYNEEHYIRQCLESVFSARTDSVKEVIVVDNASTDQTANVASQFAGVSVILERAKGNTNAKKRGLESSHSEIIAFIDADVVLPNNWFELVEREFSIDPKLICLSGPYIHPDLRKWQQWTLQLYSKLIIQPLSVFVVNYITGGNCAIRRSALKKIGGFDTRRSLGGEDLNLVRRLGKIGRCKFTQKLIAYSSGRRFRKHGFLRTCITYFIVSWGQMFLRHYLISQPADYR